MTLNATHDPTRISWIESANDPAGDFPLQNLPFGAFSTGTHGARRLGVAIGDQVFDLHGAADAGLLPILAHAGCREPDLNLLLSTGTPVWRPLRARLSELFGADTCPEAELREQVRRCLVPLADVTLHLPVRAGNYTDFYASRHHAANVGSLFRPENPLLPNYRWVPIGYHGRASSLVASGTAVRRPSGQIRQPDQEAPLFAPSERLDFELELAAIVGPGNRLGERIPLNQAPDHVFGVALLNDWSARDLQSWEYQPLGPFLAKSFATTLSPWVVTLEALAPFRTSPAPRPPGDPAPLPYLDDPSDAATGAFDLTLEVWIRSAAMRAADLPPHRLCRGNFREMYWTLGQLLTHHTSNGCNLLPGDILASGTVSGPSRDALGCLLEITRGGTVPLLLPSGEERHFLADGDEVILRGYAARSGARRIGLGECRGIIMPAT